MTVKEAAEKWGLSKNWVAQLLHMGVIPAEKTGGRWNIPDDAKKPERKEYQPKYEPMDITALGRKRFAYIRNLYRNACTHEEKVRAYILWNECRYTVAAMAKKFGISTKAVMRIYDEELEKLERVVMN